MSSLANIVDNACFLLLWWKDRNLKKVKVLEAETLIAKAHSETDMIRRDARLAANEEAMRLRAEIERSFTDRRAERAELERRLGEREGLINSQLQRIVESEKTVQEQTAALREQAQAAEKE